jgi:hypothetical protein
MGGRSLARLCRRLLRNDRHDPLRSPTYAVAINMLCPLR